MKTKLMLLAAICAASLFAQNPVIRQGGSTGTSYVSTSVANEGVTGTTVNKLAKLTGAPSTAIIAGTSDTSGIVGIVVGGAGTTGSAEIARMGQASCTFDATATTAGHYVQISSTVAGACHDAGATYPTSGQVIGFVTQTTAGSGVANVLLRPDIQAVTGGSVSAGARITVTGSTVAHTYVDGSHPGFLEDFLSWTSAAVPGSLAKFVKGNIQGTLTIADPQKSAYSTHPERNLGVIKLTTSATSGDGGVLYQITNGPNGISAQSFLFGQDFAAESVACLQGTATEAINTGLVSNPTIFSGGNDGISIRYDTATDTTWKLVVNTGGTPTVVDTTVTPTAGCHELHFTSVSGTVSAWIDNSSPVSTGTEPTTTAYGTPFLGFLTRTTAAANMEWDLLAIELRGVTARY